MVDNKLDLFHAAPHTNYLLVMPWASNEDLLAQDLGMKGWEFSSPLLFQCNGRVSRYLNVKSRRNEREAIDTCRKVF